MRKPGRRALIPIAIGLFILYILIRRLIPFLYFNRMAQRGPGMLFLDGTDHFPEGPFFEMVPFIAAPLIIFLVAIIIIVVSRRGSHSGDDYRRDQRYQRYIKDEPPHYTGDSQPMDPNPKGPAARLRELDQMRQDGLISSDEYQRKKQDILRNL